MWRGSSRVAGLGGLAAGTQDGGEACSFLVAGLGGGGVQNRLHFGPGDDARGGVPSGHRAYPYTEVAGEPTHAHPTGLAQGPGLSAGPADGDHATSISSW